MKKSFRAMPILIVFSILIIIGLFVSPKGTSNPPTALAQANTTPEKIAPSSPSPTSVPSSSLVKDTSVQTYTPPPAGYVKKDITEEVQTALPEDLAYLVTKAEETEPGRVVVNTDIVDPRGKNGSPQAMEAISICQTIVPMGYKHISIMEKDRTHFVLYGHPYVPAGECGEI